MRGFSIVSYGECLIGHVLSTVPLSWTPMQSGMGLLNHLKPILVVRVDHELVWTSCCAGGHVLFLKIIRF